MSLEMAALLVLLIAGFLVPVPLLMLHVIEAVVQAYIFGILALIYIAGAIEPIATEETLAESPPATFAKSKNKEES
jgi:F-type H+-transporting ATPase subunit a